MNAASGMAAGMLLKKAPPRYPDQEKNAGISGKVVSKALNVVSAPSPSPAAAANESVSQWEYKPYLLDGDPVEVHTTIHVIYSLGG